MTNFWPFLGGKKKQIKHGVFLSDIHLPDNIPLSGIFSYLKDLNPQIVILGGDIIDAQDMHGIENMKASDIQMAWYLRDCKLLKDFLEKIKTSAPRAEYVYLEGNHEERFRRIMARNPKPFPLGTFNLIRDASPVGMKIKWIPYGDYDSFYKLGDTIFTHGTIYPDGHAKQYAQNHAPYKVVYGHLHDYQTWTIRNAFATGSSARYAVTAGCLTHREPDYKKGAPHKWVNGFVSFIFDGEVCTPTAHIVERGLFAVGPKVYE